MTTLAHLKTINNPQIQTWLRKVEKAGVITLVYALLGADGEVKNRVLRNMSGRAADSLKAELAKYGKINVPASTIWVNSAKLEKLM